MSESRDKFLSYWNNYLHDSHPIRDTPQQSHGHLSALLLSRDSRGCSHERILIGTCSITELFLIIEKIYKIQVNLFLLL